MKKRPLGVKIFGVYFIILSLFDLVAWVTFGSKILLSIAKDGTYAFMAGPMLFATLVGALSGALGLICGIGVLRLKNWARLLSVILMSVILFAITALGILVGRPLGWRSAHLWLALGLQGMMILYFLRPGVKAQFVKAATSHK